MDMNEAQSKALERGLNDATALSQDEWRGVALAMMAQCQPWYEELERLRGAADSFRSYLDLLGDRHNELADRSESARHRDAYIAIAGAIAGIEAQGRTLGLWK